MQATARPLVRDNPQYHPNYRYRLLGSHSFLQLVKKSQGGLHPPTHHYLLTLLVY